MLWSKSNINWKEKKREAFVCTKVCLLLLTCLWFCVFLLTFFTWLRVKNKPICGCTNWNSPFILGDISLLKIAKFSLLSWHRSSKKTCIVPCFYCRPGHAFIMYAKWDPRPTCPSSRPVTFLIQVQKLNKKKKNKKKLQYRYL